MKTAFDRDWEDYINDARAAHDDAIKYLDEQRALAEERERKERIEREERLKQEAAEAERKRQADAKAKEDAERQKREADTKHKEKINSEILKALEESGVMPAEARVVLANLKSGKIPHVKIEY